MISDNHRDRKRLTPTSDYRNLKLCPPEADLGYIWNGRIILHILSPTRNYCQTFRQSQKLLIRETLVVVPKVKLPYDLEEGVVVNFVCVPIQDGGDLGTTAGGQKIGNPFVVVTGGVLFLVGSQEDRRESFGQG